jgi:hypothetical protein
MCGSMIWFGSSAGVALTNQYPEARSVFAWLRGGWHVALAYVLGFTVMLLVHSWEPDAPLRGEVPAGGAPAASAPAAPSAPTAPSAVAPALPASPAAPR